MNQSKRTGQSFWCQAGLVVARYDECSLTVPGLLHFQRPIEYVQRTMIVRDQVMHRFIKRAAVIECSTH